MSEIIQGDSLTVLKGLPDQHVNCVVTSPPYFGLRDYGVDGQMGLEPTPDEYVQKMVELFREVRRVLRDDGTLWLNIGDSYAPNWSSRRTKGGGGFMEESESPRERWTTLPGYKPKDLIGIPWALAFALRADGWFLRQDIIWHKPNPMPESVTDRCTKSHEYIFLLSKKQKYYYDIDSIRTPVRDGTVQVDTRGGNQGSDMGIKAYSHRGTGDQKITGHSGNFDKDGNLIGDGRANKKSVWTVTTKPFKEAHFATFPEDLIVDCIKAGCPPDGMVLDPFMGAGTTGLVAAKFGRNFTGIELNPNYIKIATKRLRDELGIFNPLK